MDMRSSLAYRMENKKGRAGPRHPPPENADN